MRIVQVANFYAPTSGGLRIVVEETGRGYTEAGHERILIVPGRAESVERTAAGVRIVAPSLRLPGLGNYRILISRRRVRRFLDEHRPDILEVSDKFCMPWLARWSRRRGVPIVLFSHERIDAILRPRFPAWFPLRTAADWVNRRLSALADRIVVTSAFARAEFDRVAATNVRRIPLGVDLETFRPAAGPDGAEPPTEPPTGPWVATVADGGEPPTWPWVATVAGRPVQLITVSRLSREKRPAQAIEALRVLLAQGVAASLVVVGEGPQRGQLRRRAAGLPVTFLGHVADRRALAALVARADVALSPSPAETFGLATLEALACGTPVVVPGHGAAGELLDRPGSGAISDGTAEGMAEAVRRVLAVPERQRRSAARAAAERYPWSETVAGLLRAYEAMGAARPVASVS
jgi:alpha-1,6-mannosyltransferase